MAITSNSGTTFIAAGGAVGVQINTNTNWRFYLTGSTGVPDWVHIHGNVSEITGSESQSVIVEADANSSSMPRSASGICESINEPNLTGWTGFWQLTGSTGGSGVKITYDLRLKAVSTDRVLTKITVEIPNVLSFLWQNNASTIAVNTGVITRIIVELKDGYSTSTIQDQGNNTYVVNLIGGSYSTVSPGTYRCNIGVGFSGGYYDATGRDNRVISDQGGGSYTLVSTDITGGDSWTV